jgi:hypothetical protein
MITVLRRSPISGLHNTMSLPITDSQLAAWGRGALIQNAMPHLSAEQREFLMTGITPEDWETTFGEEE